MLAVPVWGRHLPQCSRAGIRHAPSWEGRIRGSMRRCKRLPGEKYSLLGRQNVWDVFSSGGVPEVKAPSIQTRLLLLESLHPDHDLCLPLFACSHHHLSGYISKLCFPRVTRSHSRIEPEENRCKISTHRIRCLNSTQAKTVLWNSGFS